MISVPKIVAGYDIYPTDSDVDMDEIITAIPKAIPEGIRILEAEIRPVAFGLKKVFVGFMIESEDDDIGTRLEDSLRAVKDVENIECVTTSNVWYPNRLFLFRYRIVNICQPAVGILANLSRFS